MKIAAAQKCAGDAWHAAWIRHAVPPCQELFVALHKRSYQVVGTTVRDGAIGYDELDSATDLLVR